MIAAQRGIRSAGEGTGSKVRPQRLTGLSAYLPRRCHPKNEQLVALAARHAMPAIYPFRLFADIGGLIGYGGDIPALWQQAGIYIGKILQGAKPVDLPIQLSTKVELVINLKTANALGLQIPDLMLAQADEVIE
jgi:putative ABC transport system substrate-binding protein